jgi:hypothetical protein
MFLNQQPTEKQRESKARRELQKHGYILHKSRKRNWSINDQQGYMIVDGSVNGCVGGSNFDFSLQDVEAFVAREAV